ncbi:hypothetical protein [Mucilaginibacter celer]|uniref:Uncharacterized protein n=1 Tax=Mucilaginibacter celer TaxID=2305508 RepID=A0A494W5G9_9SPHI|nr:hypothetical protein [Mucilaginibacter celer]AYL99043.1 hypothetical protein HYN43_028885 [Mucilaginibacter celer]
MDAIYRKFYRSFYMRTGGFIPACPLNQQVYPGDFFQIINGEMVVLGNIYRNKVIDIENCDIGYEIRLSPTSWNFSDGVSKPYSGRGNGNGIGTGEFEFSRQILAFAAWGAFFFKGDNPESVRINNWGDINMQLIIKLTQTLYSFRELYVVTESATTSAWTLAVAGSAQGELEIAGDYESVGLADVFGHQSAKTVQSKDIEFYQRESTRRPVFFKARKLVVQDEKLNAFINELIDEQQYRYSWANEFFKYGYDHDPLYNPQVSVSARAGILDMLPANELNPNTALQYFRWADANLDDIEKLFLNYGN